MSVVTAISRLVLASGVFGLSQISKDSSPHSIFQVSKWRVIYTVILTCLLSPMIPVSIVNSYNGYMPEHPDFDLAGYLAIIYWKIMNPIGIFLALSNSILQRNNFARTVNTFCTCQETLIGLSGRSKSVTMRKFTIVFSLFWSVMTVSDFCGLDPYSGETYLELTATVYMYFITFPFAAYVLVVRSLLSDLNRGLTGFLEASPEPQRARLVSDQMFTIQPEEICLAKKKESHNNKAVDTIRKYQSLYHDIYYASQDLNSLFGTVNVWLVGHMTVMLVISSYVTQYAVRHLKTSSWQSILETIDSSRWCVSTFLILCFFIYPCTEVELETSKIIRTVDYNLSRGGRKGIVEELNKFSNFLLSHKVEFSPNNLFHLSNHLILTIISASVTYMVLLTNMPKKITSPDELGESNNPL